MGSLNGSGKTSSTSPDASFYISRNIKISATYSQPIRTHGKSPYLAPQGFKKGQSRVARNFAYEAFLKINQSKTSREIAVSSQEDTDLLIKVHPVKSAVNPDDEPRDDGITFANILRNW